MNSNGSYGLQINILKPKTKCHKNVHGFEFENSKHNG
jgi:hypothetical protein